jgi:tetratricopeptide (TPR) repeat protein
MKFNRKVPVVALALIALTAPVGSIYVRMETSQVPIERLAANLERDRKVDPKNVEKVVNLARLHVMAFALKTDVLPATDRNPDKVERPWYGEESSVVPDRKVTTATSPKQEARARQNLDKAIDYYEAALALDPTNLTAQLGYAWALEQSGQKTRAVDAYRKLIAQAWNAEQKASRGALGRRFITEEAAGYLIGLLDPVKDKAEIADLQSRRDKLRALPRPITPIAIPLADNLEPLDVLDPLARVRFDADGSGLARDWTWITADAGWLVYDPRPRPSMTSALQWFGNVTFWLFWRNGYEPLRALDDDADGELRGRELRHLAIWHDRNSNGVSDDGEVQPLASHAIVALSCAYVEGDGDHLAAYSPDGVRLKSGRTRSSYDFILRAWTTLTTRSFHIEHPSMKPENTTRATPACVSDSDLCSGSDIKP